MNALERLVAPALEVIEPLLSHRERRAVAEERSVLSSLEGSDPLVLAREVATRIGKPYFRTAERAVVRMHELAGEGARASSRSSLPIAEACVEMGLCPERDDGPILIVGRGHTAAAFLAARHVHGELPFLVLATLHRGVPGVIQREWGFANTMRSSLGVGVAQAVSRAWHETTTNTGRTVVCFSGDGELQEGICYESLRLVRDLQLDRFVLLVDANGFGIEPLTGPINGGWLEGVFRHVRTIDGTSKAEVKRALDESMVAHGPVAVIAKTRKSEGHSYRRVESPPPLAKRVGPLLKRLTACAAGGLQIATPDMAGRFGLSGSVSYLNAGLSESAAVGVLMGLPDDVTRIVATDDKYLLDSLNILSELSASARRLVVLCGQTWGIWGGAATALNMLALIPRACVYQPLSDRTLEVILTEALVGPSAAMGASRTVIVSLVDAPATPGIDDSDDVLRRDGLVAARWAQAPPHQMPTAPIAVSFGATGPAVHEAAKRLGVGHLHSIAMEPSLNSRTLKLLMASRRVLTFETNGVRGGFGQSLAARYGVNVLPYGASLDILHLPRDEQMRRFGLDSTGVQSALEAAWR